MEVHFFSTRARGLNRFKPRSEFTAKFGPDSACLPHSEFGLKFGLSFVKQEWLIAGLCYPVLFLHAGRSTPTKLKQLLLSIVRSIII